MRDEFDEFDEFDQQAKTTLPNINYRAVTRRQRNAPDALCIYYIILSLVMCNRQSCFDAIVRFL